MKAGRAIVKGISLVLQLGITMMIPIFLCLFFGKWLDEKLGTNFLLLIFLFLGMGAGFRNAYYLVRSYLRKKEESGKEGEKP